MLLDSKVNPAYVCRHLEEKQLASLRLLMLLGAQFAVATVAAVLTLPTYALFPLRICNCLKQCTTRDCTNRCRCSSATNAAFIKAADQISCHRIGSAARRAASMGWAIFAVNSTLCGTLKFPPFRQHSHLNMKMYICVRIAQRNTFAFAM